MIMIDLRKTMRGILSLLLIGVTIGGGIITAQETDAEKERARLETIQQQLKEKQTKYEQIKGTEKGLLGELQAIDRQLKDSQQKLQQLREKLQENENTLKATQTNLANLQQQYAQKNGVLAKRLRAIYKMGELGYLTPLLAISSQTDVQQQITYLQKIAESDVRLLKEAEQHMQVIRKEKQTLEKRKQEFLKSQQDIEAQSRQILAQKEQKTALLAKIQTDKEQFAQVMAGLQESAGRLDSFLDNLEIIAQTQQTNQDQAGEEITLPDPKKVQDVVKAYGRNFRANKGNLLWPVQGKIITTFGNIKIGNTYTHYKGVDIQAANGTPFYSVFKGTIKYADWFDGYGNLIIVDHGGNFYTLYAHADELLVKSGDTIETRQILGKVGDTDSIKGAHLYFEIRANGKPQNPQTWLAKVQ